MKRLIIVFLICIFPVLSHAHPGKTNRYGGHKCLKGCAEWGLLYDEYHLHDEDWKPIRIARKKISARPAVISDPVKAPTETVPAQKIIDRETVTIYRYVTTVKEERVLYTNPLLYVLLILLLLLVILRINRKKERLSQDKS